LAIGISATTWVDMVCIRLEKSTPISRTCCAPVHEIRIVLEVRFAGLPTAASVVIPVVSGAMIDHLQSEALFLASQQSSLLYNAR